MIRIHESAGERGADAFFPSLPVDVFITARHPIHGCKPYTAFQPYKGAILTFL